MFDRILAPVRERKGAHMVYYCLLLSCAVCPVFLIFHFQESRVNINLLVNNSCKKCRFASREVSVAYSIPRSDDAGSNPGEG